MKSILIKKYGKFGNNIMQHMLALYIKHAYPDINIYRDEESIDFLNLCNIKLDAIPHFVKNNQYKTIIIKNSKVDIEQILNEIAINDNVLIIIAYNIFLKKQYEELLPIYRSIYCSKSNVKGFDSKHLVINIRLGDIAEENSLVHPNMPVLPFSFHKFLIEKTGLRPVFLGQLDDGYYTTHLKKAFPSALFVPSRGTMQDFECLRKSKNISIAVSTFSLLAAFLANDDSTIHIPLYGLFNKTDRPDLDYAIERKNFIHYPLPSIIWKNNEEQKKEIVSGQNYHYYTL